MPKVRTIGYITASALGAAAAFYMASRYRRWRAAVMDRLQSRSRVLQTARGPMEFATLGEGQAVLVVHGLLGGYDQGFVVAKLLALPEFQFIAVSRPGYLRTPLETGRTFEEQADAMAALLDTLEIQRATVIGISAGGGPTLAFVKRHPDRCAGLVLLSAVTKRLLRGEVDLPHVIRLAETVLADPGSWLLQRALHWNSALISRGVLLPDELGRLRDPAVKEAFLELTDTFVPLSPRTAGMFNDEVQIKALPQEVSPVACPRVLIIHGTADTLVPYDQAASQAAVVPGAELLPISGGGHLAAIFHAPEVRAAITRLLRAPELSGNMEGCYRVST